MAKAAGVLAVLARNRALLARQHLLDRSALDPYTMITHLVGMQSQWPQTPYVGLWSRVDGFAPAQLATLLTERAVVRIVVMRSTLHLVTGADSLALRALVQPALSRGFRTSLYWKRLTTQGATEADLAVIAAAGQGHAEAAPRTFGELAELLAVDFPQWHGPSMAQVARAHLPLVQVPPRGLWKVGGAPRHTTATAWLTLDHPAKADPDRFVLRYLAAYGPATVADAQAFLGLTRLGEVFERLGGQVLRFTDEDGRVLYDVPDAPRPAADQIAPVRFLPEFDSVLLAHADKRHLLAPGDQARIFTKNGIVLATVLVGGIVSATWRLDGNVVTVTPLRRLSKKDITAITAEGRRLLAFAAPGAAGAEVVVSPVPAA